MSDTPEELTKKIKEARERLDPVSQGGDASNAGSDRGASAKALRAATDLVAALCVGGFLGYWIDRWLGTTPWGMVIFFFLGFVAGFLNIYRAQMGQDFKVGFQDKTKNK